MPSYASPTQFATERIRAAAVYCSDGRFGEQFDDLLQLHLRLPRYDRLALPGGSACLAGHPGANREEETASAHLEFLITTHKLEHLVLIAHQHCAFYVERLKMPESEIEAQQLEDLKQVIARAHRFDQDLRVDGYLARLIDHKVVFERIKT
jgi:hypothetical protein